MNYMPGAEPFLFEASDTGILALHGFSGSCFEMRELSTRLHADGYSVMGSALAGHGTHPGRLAGISADDFFAAAQEAYEHARSRFRRLVVIGNSMGGTLGLHLAAQHAFDGLVTIAAPVFMSPLVTRSIPLARQWSPWRNLLSNLAAWRGHVVGYRSTPISSLEAFLQVLERVKGELSSVRVPLLMLHSKRDETVPVENARYIYDRVNSSIKRLRILSQGPHLITIPPYLNLIEKDIKHFLQEVAGSLTTPGTGS